MVGGYTDGSGSTLSIANAVLTKKEKGGGRLVGTIEAHRIPITAAIVDLQLRWTVSEHTVVSLIQKEHLISYTLQGTQVALDKSFDLTALAQTESSRGASWSLRFAIDLPKAEANQIGPQTIYRQEDTLRHNEEDSSIVQGYCASSKQGPGADRATRGSCEIKSILGATFTIAVGAGDACTNNCKVECWGVPLRTPTESGSKPLLLSVRTMNRPAFALCGLLEISRNDYFSLCLQQRARATKTIVKLTQRISWSAKSNTMLQYVEMRGRHSPPIVRSMVPCERPKTLIVQDQCLYWQQSLDTRNEGVLSFPRSRRIRSTVQGRSIDVYHELWVCVYDANGQVVATSQPISITIQVES